MLLTRTLRVPEISLYCTLYKISGHLLSSSLASSSALLELEFSGGGDTSVSDLTTTNSSPAEAFLAAMVKVKNRFGEYSLDGYQRVRVTTEKMKL